MKQMSLFDDEPVYRTNRYTGDQWKEHAYDILTNYAMFSRTFMTEDVREYAHNECALPEPEDSRAWGGVVARARANGVIKRVGAAPMKSKHCHRDVKAVWQYVDSTESHHA